MTKLVVVLVVIGLTGCAGMSKAMQHGLGKVTTTQSKFDDAREVVMQPAYVAPVEGGMAKIALGFSWRSTAPQDVLVLVRVVTLSGAAITGAALNVGGQTITLSASESFTQHHDALVVTMSDKLFFGPLSMLRVADSSRVAKVRVDTGRTSEVGDLWQDSWGNVTVRDSLPSFLQAIDAAIGPVATTPTGSDRP